MAGAGKGRMTRGVRAALAVVLAVASLATGGCWDRVEIQDRAFVIAAAVDVAEAETAEKPGKAAVEGFVHPEAAPRYRVTLQVMRFGGSKGGEEKAGGATDTYLVTSSGPGMFEAVRDALGQSSKGLWFENMQAVIISQKVVERYGLAPVLDFWRRDAEMRWRAQVFVTPGEAGKILAIKPPSGEPGGIYLANVARRHGKASHLAAARTDISFVSQALDGGGDMVFPVLEPAGNTVKLKGGAMFKGQRFVGYMDEYTVQGLRMARATEKSVLLTFECPHHPGSAVTFELFRHQTILKPVVDGDRVAFRLSVAMRGNIGEVQCESQHDTTDVEWQTRAQELFAEAARRNIEHSIAFGQRHGWEMFYFKRALQAYEPKTWARVKDRWEEMYPTVPVEVRVRVSIINVGEHR